MNAPTALLYVQEAAWQSPRVAAKKAAPARDVDSGDDEIVTRTIKRHWGPIVTILGVVVPVLLAYGDIKKDLAVLSIEVENLKSKPSAARGGGAPGPSASAKPLLSAAPSASVSMPAPSASLSAPPSQSGWAPGNLAGPKGKTKAPPVCVNPAPVSRFSCDQTASCRGISQFNPSFVADVRAKLQIDASREILFCDPEILKPDP